jgi:hypothetical protein
LLRVYNNTPIQRYNQETETLYPVTLSIVILKVIIVVNDSFNERQGEKRAEKLNLRKKFMANDGLKYLFAVKICDPHCTDPDAFQQTAKLSDFLQRHLHNDLHNAPMIDSFVNVLINNRQSMIQTYEAYIKQLLFIQYKQNCKRDSKKDILEWYKPVFDAIESSHAQSYQAIQSPKASKKQGQKPSATSTRKHKSEKKEKVNQSESSANLITKHQSKQLKILMKKNETYNEVPLKQFIEFFMQSQVSMQIDYFEYFLIACKNVCLVDVADSHETGDGQPQPGKTQKITTIRLKNSILKELILDSRYDPLSPQGAGLSSNASSWLFEYKKRIPDF